jgi:hypothetical protein
MKHRLRLVVLQSQRTRSFSNKAPAPEHCDIIKGPSLLRTTVARPRPSLLFLPGLRSLPFWTKWDGSTNTNRVAYQDETISPNMKSDYQTDTEHSLHKGTWDWHSYMTKGTLQGNFATHFPETTTILQVLRDEGLLFEGTPFGYSFFSTLHAQSSIEPHSAPMNFRVRVHLPLIVPEESTDNTNNTDQQQQQQQQEEGKRPCCGMRVGQSVRSWDKGRALVFDDAYEHEVWNDHEKQNRVLLLVDLWHPDVTKEERQDIVQLFQHARDQGWWSNTM